MPYYLPTSPSFISSTIAPSRLTPPVPTFSLSYDALRYMCDQLSFPSQPARPGMTQASSVAQDVAERNACRYTGPLYLAG